MVRPSVRREGVRCIAFTFQTYRREGLIPDVKVRPLSGVKVRIWMYGAMPDVKMHIWMHGAMIRCVTVPSWRAPVWREGAMIKAIE